MPHAVRGIGSIRSLASLTMPLETLFISGPSMGGKTTVAQMVAKDVLDRPVHYIRMRRATDGHTNTVVAESNGPVSDGIEWKSRHHVTYTTDRVFETLPDGLRAVRRIERRGFTIIEADGDPALRHAYPYDYRIFVMPPPPTVHAVFRDAKAAAIALQQVMQDTAAFASEIFGLFDAAGLDDSVGVQHVRPTPTRGYARPMEKLHVGESQIRQFLSSPLGAEIASRIQLQPEFYALVESDVTVINIGVGPVTTALEESVKRLEKLLARVRHDARRHSVLYWGDIVDTHDPARVKLMKRLRALFAM